MALQAKITIKGVPLDAAYVQLTRYNGTTSWLTGEFSIIASAAVAKPEPVFKEVPTGEVDDVGVALTEKRPDPMQAVPVLDAFSTSLSVPEYVLGDNPFAMLYEKAKTVLADMGAVDIEDC